MNFNLVSPETTEDLLHVIDENHGKKFRFGAGYTDLIRELEKQDDRELTVINLAKLSDRRFTSIEEHTAGGMRIGALVTASRIVSHKELKKRYPVLGSAASQLASRQIRQVATIGGNLCTASPAGDLGCALVALGAQCEALSAVGETRIIPINDFFVAVRETGLKRNEVLRGVVIPPGDGKSKIYSDFVKIGTRRSMEIAIVSIAYHIEADEDDIITHAGIAIGSVAPTIRYVHSACEYLVGRRFSSIGRSESEEFAARVLEYASPISDIRASAWYRREVLYNIGKSIFGRR
jgi:CO/xanthine dehydrogenase FAD-binding subunit